MEPSIPTPISGKQSPSSRLYPAGKPVADPLNLYDCSLISDGARRSYRGPPPIALLISATTRVRVPRHVAQASDSFALDQKPDITTFPAVKAASVKAYKMAVESASPDIEFGELHDCFTIAGNHRPLEDLGFVPRGQGGPCSAAGYTALHGAEANERERRPQVEGPSCRSDPAWRKSATLTSSRSVAKPASVRVIPPFRGPGGKPGRLPGALLRRDDFG